MADPIPPAINRQAEINYRNDYFDPRNPHPGETLLQTLDYCFQAGIPVPEWAQEAYRKCYKKYQQRIGDEPLAMAFDTDQDAGKNTAKQRRQQKHMQTVCHTLWHLHINEGWPIDDELFKEVAARHGNIKGLRGSTIKKEFYPIVKSFIETLGGLVVCDGFVKPPVR